MPLHKRSSSHFRSSERQRGDAWYKKGWVHRLDIRGDRAFALVEGPEGEHHGVGLDWEQVPENRKLHSFCQCKRFADGRPCEHVRAVLVAFDEQGHEQPAGRDRVSLRKDRPGAWKDLDAWLASGGEEIGVPAPPPGRTHLARPQRGRGRGNGGDVMAGGWRAQIEVLRDEVERLAAGGAGTEEPEAGADRELRYLVNTSGSDDEGGVLLEIFTPRGKSGKLHRTRVEPDEVDALILPDPATGRRDGPAVITALPDEASRGKGRGRRGRGRAGASGVRLLKVPPALYHPVLPHLAAAGELGWWDGRNRNQMQLVEWDDGEPWELVLRLDVEDSGVARVRGNLERGGERRSLRTPVLLLPGDDGSDGSFVLFKKSLARLGARRQRDLPWIAMLREREEIALPRQDLEEALAALFELPELPRLETPDDLALSEVDEPPRPRLVLEPDPALVGDGKHSLPNPPLLASLSFLYGNLEVSAADPRAAVVDREEGRFVRRDLERENRALVRLVEAGARPVASAAGEGHDLELDQRDLPTVAEPLLADGWEVVVKGSSLRSPRPPSLQVKSGIDWFEVSGSADFAGADPVELKEIFDAVSRGDRFIELSDGSRGLLPEEWMETYDSLADLAQEDGDDGLRFLPSQALMVDALLATMPEPDVDSAFAELREKMRSFERIKPKKEPRSFKGTLRGYQRHGLGWLTFLREFGLGGVLADDMGLGKTVQVLALLRTYRTKTKSTGLPSLVVAPRSLVYNWLEEAERFTPDLKAVEYLGRDREALRDEIDDYDVVVTTYGTLRRDVDYLATVEFDTLVLDEAQAIKNRDSQSAKASRLLDGHNRLALTGTPIENHLGELGSIFEFLNPGLLGHLPALDVLASGRNASQRELALVREGLKPFILRRTKAEVLPDLPPKTEQVLYSTLEGRQRELYDKLRASYQASLMGEIEAKGVGGSTMQVLEALLRLRQVACHPGLVDSDWAEAGSAKLESLFEQVDEVLEEGHKLVVFSQFTSLLAYVREHLDADKVPYAYLDGKTQDRKKQVDRFQDDPETNIFLVSLKAGGTGLNLTAAGYVFLLDPWWNPAVEAQAIDRTHRIGQTQPVFAYRMIARDTVEEKILGFQRSKRELADAILGGEGTRLSELTADDLKLLLS